MTKVLKTPIIIVPDAKITRTDLNNEVYGKQLSKFIDNMEARFDKKDLDFFYNNINRINFSSDTFDSIDGGGYDPVTNNIILNDKFNEKLDKSLTHELSHSASNYYDQKKGVAYCGFAQFRTNGSLIGRGLMEGYTVLFTERLLSPDDVDPMETIETFESYPIETGISYMLENTIGRDKMQSMYLRADLKGLIEELKKYESTTEIMKFIKSIDYVNKYTSNGYKIPPFELPKFLTESSYVAYYARYLLLNKEKEAYKSGLISKQQFNAAADEYVEFIDSNISFNPIKKNKIKSKILNLTKH